MREESRQHVPQTAAAESAAPQSTAGSGTGADDLQTQAVVDQPLHRHRPRPLPAIGPGRAAGWGSTTPNAKPAPPSGYWPAPPTPSVALVGLTLRRELNRSRLKSDFLICGPR